MLKFFFFFFGSIFRLLYWGTLRFGIGNWHIIQRELLPGKTSLQVKTLYKNLQSSRVPDNPMKELSRYLRQPLNDREKKILKDVIEHYGPQFDSISMFFLPHRTPSALRRAWYELSKEETSQTASISSYTMELPTSENPELPSTTTTSLSVQEQQHHIIHSELHDSKDSLSPKFSYTQNSSPQLTRQGTLILSPQSPGLISPTKHPSSSYYHSSSFF